MGTERTWGVTPVPDRLRTLSLLDTGLLWGNLGISLLVLFTGTFLAGLGLQRALLAAVVGAALGTALLGLAGLIGFERRVPGMVLLRDPLGRQGSYLPTGLNVAQNLGWGVFELFVISTAANALADEVFGFRERWLWVLVFGALTAALALAGPISFVRRYVRRFAVWVVAASVGYLVWWALDGAGVSGLWSAAGEGGITFWQGVDLTVAMAASWLPLAADYTRFSRSGRAAFWGTAVGYFVPLVVLYGLGALLLLSRDLADTTALFTAIAAGGAASAVALLALTVDETDEPFANVYSAAVSLQNLLPRAPQRGLILLAGGAATLGALLVDIVAYGSFLFLLGSCFVPLFG
ncbi:MAG: cytosine permease, partial [Gaiellaceae bacterium]